MVIISIILVVLEYSMSHTRFQGHLSIGSGGVDFRVFLPYIGMVAKSVM